MGYASYLEDIRDRLAEDLDLMTRGLKELEESRYDGSDASLITGQVQRITTIHRQCEALLSEIDRLLDLATAPEVDVAFQLTKAREENQKQKVKYQILYRQLAETDEKLRKAQEENKKIKKELNRLTRKLDDPRFFKAAIDAYSDSDSIEHHKPNEVKKRR